MSILHIKKQSGIGLIELLISMLIGLLVMAGVVQLFSTTSQNAVATAGSSRIQENMRYAFTRFSQDLSQTGNLGCISSSLNQDVVNDPKNVDGIPLVENLLGFSSGVNDLYDFGTIVNGVESADNTSFPAGFVAAGTDTFQVRFANNADRIQITDSDFSTITVDDAGTLSENQVVLAADCSQGAVFMITDITGNVITHAAGSASGSNQYNNRSVRLYPFKSIISESPTSLAYLYASSTGAYQYFVGTSAAATAASETCNPTTAPQNCALFVRDSGENLELVEGVHDMQVLYGWNTATDQLFFTNANGVTNWDVVDRVSVTLSFNSINNAIASGNNLDTLIEKSVTRIFNLPNQLEPQ